MYFLGKCLIGGFWLFAEIGKNWRTESRLKGITTTIYTRIGIVVKAWKLLGILKKEAQISRVIINTSIHLDRDIK